MSFELDIESLAFGGSGVGRKEGKAVFVPLTAPGDRIRCRTIREHKRYVEGEIEEIVVPSPLRRAPPCPVFGTCGGCQWQHLPYHVQGSQKEKIFADSLQRHCGIGANLVRSIAPSPEEWNYRSRVQFKCRQTATGFVMGFYRRGSHFVVDVADCPITAHRLNEVLRLFRAWLPSSPAPDRVPQVDLDLGDDGMVRAVVHVLGAPDLLTDYLRPLAEGVGLSLFIQSGRKDSLMQVAGDEDLEIKVGEPTLGLRYGAGGFAQVNLPQNRAMIKEVVAAAALTGRERVLDLFCGMGNFSIPLASGAAEVIGVEDYAPSIAKARQNAERNDIRNAVFHAAPAEGAARRFAEGKSFDLVVLDPPRTGAYGVTRDLAAVRPGRILYVSCDPSTLARDLQPLLHGGYSLEWSRPFDLFPQTYHVESVTLLTAR